MQYPRNCKCGAWAFVAVRSLPPTPDAPSLYALDVRCSACSEAVTGGVVTHDEAYNPSVNPVHIRARAEAEVIEFWNKTMQPGDEALIEALANRRHKRICTCGAVLTPHRKDCPLHCTKDEHCCLSPGHRGDCAIPF